MLRKAALLPLIAVALIGSTDRGPVPSAVIRAQPCPGADLTRARPVLAKLFVDASETRAVAVLVDGCPALTMFAPNYSADTRFISWSMAKTVTAMLVGALVSDRWLKLDDPAPVAEWHARAGDPRARITLRELLQMRSGLEHTEIGDPIAASDTNQTLFVSGPAHMAADAIAHPLEAAPGTKYEYSSLTSIILAEIVTRTLTSTRDPHERARVYRRFAQERLFGPAGVTSAVLEFDGAGTQVGGSLMHMTLADWGRMGTLLLDGRARDGSQVIAPAWLAFMKTPSPTNPEYGGHTWINRADGVEGGAKLFPAASENVATFRGHLGQFVAADPAGQGQRGVVLIRLGHTQDEKLAPVTRLMGEALAALEK